jgi:hypothetical protein
LSIRRDFSGVKSDRFKIQATLHEQATSFWENLEWYRQWVRVDVDLFGSKNTRRDKEGIRRKIKYNEVNKELSLDSKRFMFTPDGRLWINDRMIGNTYLKEIK